jgi:hypothetical protein
MTRATTTRATITPNDSRSRLARGNPVCGGKANPGGADPAGQPPSRRQPGDAPTDARPDRALLVAILRDAIECFRENLHATDRTGRRLFADAEAWLMATDGAGPLRFTDVCDFLELEPAYLRRLLRVWELRERRRARAA